MACCGLTSAIFSLLFTKKYNVHCVLSMQIRRTSVGYFVRRGWWRHRSDLGYSAAEGGEPDPRQAGSRIPRFTCNHRFISPVATLAEFQFLPLS